MSRGERYHVMWVHGQPTVYDSKEGAVIKTFRESEENDAERLANELNSSTKPEGPEKVMNPKGTEP